MSRNRRDKLPKHHAENKRPAGRRPVWRVLAGAAGVLMAVWSVLPLLFNGLAGIGVWIPLAVGIVVAVWGFCRPSGKQHRKGWRRMLVGIVTAAVSVVAALSVVIILLMTAAATHNGAPEDATLVVLGAKVNRSGYPSLMLAGRLNMAIAYLQAHPEAKCIVTGGQGSDEPDAEANVMYDYLVAAGIAPERVFREDRSVDTHQNIDYALAIIREQGMSEHLVIATQEFHQYRASVLARWAGAASVSSATCGTPFHLLLYYWVRECAAICRLWLLHY